MTKCKLEEGRVELRAACSSPFTGVHQTAAALPASVTDPTPTTTIEADELDTYVERKK